MLNDVLIFHSDRFSSDPPVDDRGLRYDMPFGDDVAVALKSGIESRSEQWRIDDPVREDFGTMLVLHRDHVVINMTIL